MSNIKILVATHKKYNMPTLPIYVPIHVGCEGKEPLGYLGDNTGENISKKNSSFCELTAMYWAWKNLDTKILGLNHYRRYFTNKNLLTRIFTKNKLDIILNEEEIKKIMKKNDLIISKKRKLIIKNVKTKYIQQHYEKDLIKCEEILKEKYPDYAEDFDKIMLSKEISICNMFIGKKKIMDDYFSWLFDILFELESQTDLTNYSILQKRIYGFISERLFNVWMLHQKDLKIIYLPILSLEHDSFKIIIKKSYRRILKIKS